MKHINHILKTINIVLITILLLFFTITLSYGQGNPPHIPPGCDNPVPWIKNPNCDPDPVPLGGLEYLLGAGLLYGVKRIKDRNKQ